MARSSVLPGNVTVEMGLALVDLAAHLPPDMTLDTLERGVAEGSAPRDFLTGWRDFLTRYGHRRPGEIDVASPRSRDRPRMLLSQLAGVAGAVGTDASPRAIYERSQRERRAAFEALDARAAAKGWLTQKRFRSLYAVVEALGGLRETPKFLLVQAFNHVRARALAEADALIAAGRLDARGDVFGLTFEELGAGLADASIDLRAQVKAHRDELRRLQGRTEPPRFLDSRGRILRPAPPPLREGEFACTRSRPASCGGGSRCCTRRTRSRSCPARCSWRARRTRAGRRSSSTLRPWYWRSAA